VQTRQNTDRRAKNAPPWRWPVLSLILVGALWSALAIVTESANPSAYYRHELMLDRFSYPFAHVGAYLLLIAIEVVGLDWWFCYGVVRTLWFKASIPAVALIPISLLGMVTLMHAPPYSGLHAIWIVLLNATLLLIAMLSGCVALFTTIRNRVRHR
jgi:hypothetical protein